MNRKEKIEIEVNKTLEMFDKKESLTPNPFFITRIKQRINESSNNEKSFISILKPAFFSLLIVINISTAVWYSTSTVSIQKGSSNLTEVLSSDLNLTETNTTNILFE